MTLLPFGSTMFRCTSSRTGFAGKVTDSGANASRSSSSLCLREKSVAATLPDSSSFGIAPKYFSRRGSKTSLGGSLPAKQNVHSFGVLAHSLKTWLAFLKLHSKTLKILEGLKKALSDVMHFTTRFLNLDDGSRNSAKRFASNPSFTKVRRPWDLSVGSTGQRNKRFVKVSKNSKSVGEVEAAKEVLYALIWGKPGSHRFPSRHSWSDSMDKPQMPSIIAALPDTLASVLTAPLREPDKTAFWWFVRPPQR
mmetsp:Transcript_41688/g.76078  ORF Transcript_41688/g.76078 Transcript_41688/m.76078 type:complete len:251 (+) Transcript_41688:941-1693(+)